MGAVFPKCTRRGPSPRGFFFYRRGVVGLGELEVYLVDIELGLRAFDVGHVEDHGHHRHEARRHHHGGQVRGLVRRVAEQEATDRVPAVAPKAVRADRRGAPRRVRRLAHRRDDDGVHHGGAQAQGEGADEEAGLCGGRGGGGAADDGVGDLTEGDKGEAAHDELPAAKAVRVEAEEELEQPFGQVVGEGDVGYRLRIDWSPRGLRAPARAGPGLGEAPGEGGGVVDGDPGEAARHERVVQKARLDEGEAEDARVLGAARGEGVPDLLGIALDAEFREAHPLLGHHLSTVVPEHARRRHEQARGAKGEDGVERDGRRFPLPLRVVAGPDERADLAEDRHRGVARRLVEADGEGAVGGAGVVDHVEDHEGPADALHDAEQDVGPDRHLEHVGQRHRRVDDARQPPDHQDARLAVLVCVDRPEHVGQRLARAPEPGGGYLKAIWWPCGGI
mmetsp:Transcript_19589/g.44455  ORF Transcript_19589/g.44455 Transcript_19589/m.44455 type:complete len:448 (-) Transcript_19589:521-1864(-)